MGNYVKKVLEFTQVAFGDSKGNIVGTGDLTYTAEGLVVNNFISSYGLKPRTQTWAEIVALKASGGLYIGNTFIVSDQANKQVLISGYSPDGNFWYKDTDIYGVETINKVE